MGVISFFFLFNVLDVDNKQEKHIIWIKTICIYLLYICMTKNKYMFSLPVLFLLIIEKSIYIHIKHLEYINEKDNDKIVYWENKRTIISWIIIFIVVLHYIYRQYQELGDQFSWMSFFVYQKCS